MQQARVLGPSERLVGPTQQFGALELARRLPSLVLMARQVAATVSHGVHGRRRAGVGETFWQFRPYVMGESTSRIDWRRSARDDHVYVREREQEAAHTVWIWIDRSASMGFVSSLALQAKIDRAVVLGLAAADLLVRGGERVGLLGSTRPLAARDIIDRLAEAMIGDSRQGAGTDELPRAEPLAPRTRAILIGDFLSDPSSVATVLRTLASRGALGHLLAVSDPIEDTFPFVGHTELLDVDSAARLRVGRAEDLRAEYMRRLAEHRDAVREAAARWGWTCLFHRTDRPASEALLALRGRLEAADGAPRLGGAS
jgi:uncharacterized protein (DUF58 family)